MNRVGSNEKEGAGKVKEEESKLGLCVVGCAMIGQGGAVKMLVATSVVDIQGQDSEGDPAEWAEMAGYPNGVAG